MTNMSNLFKEAIADAKAVRTTALANAKVALEEAFSERYHAMFAEKLKEDAAAEEEGTAMGMAQQEQENVSEQEIDELIKELEAEVGQEPHAEPDGDEVPPAAGAVPPAPVLPPAVPPAAGGVPPGCPPVMPAAPGVAPVPPVPGAVPGAEPMAAAPGAPIAPEVPPTAPPPSEVPPAGEEETDEDIDLNELLESLKQEVEEGYEEEEEEENAKLDEQKKLSSSAIGGKVGGSDNKEPSASASSSSDIESGNVTDHGVPQGKQTASEPTEATRPNEGAHATKTNLSTPSMGGGSGPALKASRPNSKGDFENTAKLHEENQSLKKNLSEAMETITYVKGQLNEVNLLNAKLLYTNKLFKEFNMNNEQKMRVVEMFDLSKNVREVKLTYATIAESLNFGGDMKKPKKPSSSGNVQSITEGLASKPVGSTKPTQQIISESAMVSKFQKLAGIKKS